MKEISIPEKLNIVLKGLSQHDQVRFMETLQRHPDLLQSVLDNIDAKLEASDADTITVAEAEQIKTLLNDSQS